MQCRIHAKNQKKIWWIFLFRIQNKGKQKVLRAKSNFSWNNECLLEAQNDLIVHQSSFVWLVMDQELFSKAIFRDIFPGWYSTNRISKLRTNDNSSLLAYTFQTLFIITWLFHSFFMRSSLCKVDWFTVPKRTEWGLNYNEGTCHKIYVSIVKITQFMFHRPWSSEQRTAKCHFLIRVK